MAWAIIAAPRDRQMQEEVISPFPDRAAAYRFANYLETENRYWDYRVAVVRAPVPVSSGGILLPRRY